MDSKPPSQSLTLFRGHPPTNTYAWSPFVTKVEFRLRTSSTPYTLSFGSLSSAPKGKIPYLKLEGEEQYLADSTLIIKHLAEEEIVRDLNSRLDAMGRALDLALRALLEDKLYFYHSRERWLENYPTMRDNILASLPYPVRLILGLLIYRQTAQGLQKQGTGRFSADEIRAFRLEIWTAFNDLLRVSAQGKDKSEGECFWVLGGEEPTEADAALFGFVVSVLVCKAGPESREVVKGFPVVVEYAERIHDRYFPDYQKWD